MAEARERPAVEGEILGVIEANEAALRELAAKLGGEVRAIDEAQHREWAAPTSHYEHARVLEGELRGTRIAVVASFVTHSTRGRGASQRVSFAVHHRVAALRPDATVSSVLASSSYAVPFIGELKAPHFEWSAQASSATESAWMLDDDRKALPPGGETFRFGGCYDGALYASVGGPSLDPAAVEQALDALVTAAALRWRPATDEERAARRKRALGRARRRLALGCLLNLAVFGLIGWGIYALVT